MNHLERDPYGMYNMPTSGGAGPGPELMGADTLNGNDLYNLKDEDLGDIKEIMLNMRTGRISYAVVSYGGFLSMGKKLFAVPWETLKLDTKNKRFVLNVDKDRLESAAGFDKDNWPNMADTVWAEGGQFLLWNKALYRTDSRIASLRKHPRTLRQATGAFCFNVFFR